MGRWIYLSPHLDDAVLSCGGLIHQQIHNGIKVEIWTVFAGDPPELALSPFAELQHTSWNLTEKVMEERRREDINACQVLGARYRHFSFQDCIYRSGKNGKWLYASEEELYGEVSSEDERIKTSLSELLKMLLKPDDMIVSPMAMGNHVDHQIVHSISSNLLKPTRFYPDIPYYLRNPVKAIETGMNLQKEVFSFSQPSIELWLNSISCYKSQINNLFGDSNQMVQMITSYFSSNLGICLWSGPID